MYFDRMNRIVMMIAACLAVAAFSASCATSRKAERLREERLSARLALPERSAPSFREIELPHLDRDSVAVHEFQGRDVIIMNAVRDESSGEMVANETLQAARVTARFRNVAERNGRVDLEFQVIVPAVMQDSRWQVRFHPKMSILDEIVPLDDILITGREYRKAQLRGYQQYDRFLRSIVTDSTRFIDRNQLKWFIRRNVPYFDVTEQQAVDYYTYGVLVRRNERKIQDKDRMFRKYVRAPFQTERLRLDTVMVNEAGEFVYNYVQTIATRPKLRKVDILLSGEIFEQDKVVYDIPGSDPLTFYISSLSTFVDERPRYLDQVISRQVDVQTDARLLFDAGDDSVREELGDNYAELGRIRSLLASLLGEEDFVLDSVVVTAHASPEGSWRANSELSLRRSRSVSRYFTTFMKHYTDSVDRDAGIRLEWEGTTGEGARPSSPEIRFTTYAVPENWDLLDQLVKTDTVLDARQKQRYREHRAILDPDLREQALRQESDYAYIHRELYPKLRTVVFDFRLHRRDLARDTVHTTMLDTTYMAGIQAIRDRDYQRAVTLLRPYADFNTAIAYCCLDYNASALAILEKLERSAEVDYMLALLYSRAGDDRRAVACYRSACSRNGAFVHRGNLDPEVSKLIRRYELNMSEYE